MKAKNIKLYHFHNPKCMNALWKEGNTLFIDKNNYESYFLKEFDGFIRGINFFGFNFSIYKRLNKRIENGEIPEDGIDLYLTRCINVENALEEYRSIYYPDLPSRYTSIFLCDEDSIKHWNNIFSKLHYSLFEVEVTGNLFKTSEMFIPIEVKKYEEYQSDAPAYWNPTFETQEQLAANEYLFNGEVKILKKIR